MSNASQLDRLGYCIIVVNLPLLQLQLSCEGESTTAVSHVSYMLYPFEVETCSAQLKGFVRRERIVQAAS
jgi:hypothetical protein